MSRRDTSSNFSVFARTLRLYSVLCQGIREKDRLRVGMIQPAEIAGAKCPSGRPRDGVLLWVIGLAQKGVKHFLSAGLFAARRGLDRDEYGTEFLSPAPGHQPSTANAHALGIRAQEAQAARGFGTRLRHRPDLKTAIGV